MSKSTFLPLKNDILFYILKLKITQKLIKIKQFLKLKTRLKQ